MTLGKLMQSDDDRKRREVERILLDLKEIIYDKGINFVPRIEHKNALIELGLTKNTCIDIFFNLSVMNYSSGPEPDDEDLGGYIWIFGKEIDSVEVYIKIKIFTIDGTDYAKCLSFHSAKYSLDYPFI